VAEELLHDARRKPAATTVYEPRVRKKKKKKKKKKKMTALSECSANARYHSRRSVADHVTIRCHTTLDRRAMSSHFTSHDKPDIDVIRWSSRPRYPPDADYRRRHLMPTTPVTHFIVIVYTLIVLHAAYARQRREWQEATNRDSSGAVRTQPIT